VKHKKHHIFGIRHHGPGSARKLQAALQDLAPDIVLLEGPPDGNKLLELAAHMDMDPPVALLIYNPKAHGQAAFYPFARFSPEWQAIQYALREQIPAQFIDLPIGYRWYPQTQAPEHGEALTPETGVRTQSPLDRIAAQAGYPDGERWWNEWVEKRIEGEHFFPLITELMASLRNPDEQESEETYLREAYMRREIRKAYKQGYQRIAVICGAFHAPVLDDLTAFKDDTSLLKGLKKLKSEACWIPWTYERLAYQSGYGAGVRSPAWYEMLFDFPQENLSVRWLGNVSQHFRAAGLDASPAHAIEAVRLSESLAALRGLPLPGLDEMKEAVEAIFCYGQKEPMELVERALVIGQKMGKVPEEAPQFPLQKDILSLKRKYRLKDQTSKDKPLDLDLREERQLAKSHFLHRLQLIRVQYGQPNGQLNQGKKGSFHEYWQLDWQPELELSIIQAAPLGNTLKEAASRHIHQLLREEISLPELPQWIDKSLLAGLNEVIPALVRALEAQVALDTDLSHLMDTLPKLVNILRYGDVRKTDPKPIQQVIDSMLPRIIVGLPSSVMQLSPEFAEKRCEQILQIHQVLPLLPSQDHQQDWLHVLGKISIQQHSHPKIQGMCSRILFDQDKLTLEEAAQYMDQALSPGTAPREAADWLDGFLHGSALLLIHHPSLWKLLNDWLVQMEEELFMENMPLLRRIFSRFATGEKRQLGELARYGKPQAQNGLLLDPAREALVMGIAKNILS